MNDTTKAQIQSIIRAGMNLFAGYHSLSPDTGDKITSAIIAIVALAWTIIDNWRKADDKPAAPGINVPLSAFIIGLCLSSGCARFVGKTDTRADGQSVTTFRAYTFFDSKNELSKLAIRQTTTNKLNQSFGLSEMRQESSSTNLNALIGDIVGAAVKAAKAP